MNRKIRPTNQEGQIVLSEVERQGRSVSAIDKLTVDPTTMEMSRSGNAIHLRAKVTPGMVSSSEMQIVRLTGPFQKDPVDGTGCSGSPSPHCYYPGRMQSLDCAGWHDGDSVWVVFWYAYASVPGIGGNPPTVVSVDGTGAHTCRNMGFSYNPNGAGTLPVYASTEYAAAWAIGCMATDGAAQPTAVLGG